VWYDLFIFSKKALLEPLIEIGGYFLDTYLLPACKAKNSPSEPDLSAGIRANNSFFHAES